jgi:hypothetical protein
MTSADASGSEARPAPPYGGSSGVRPPPPTAEEVFYQEATITCRALTVLCQTITEAIRCDMKRDGYESNRQEFDR